MQPSYLPWLGFFNLVMNSDVFIFLDDVQYSKNTFFNRNRYSSLSKEGFTWLTVPVKKEKLSQLISQSLLVEEEKWRKRHITTLQHAYGRMPFFKEVYPILEKEILDVGNDTLGKLNISLIKAICNYLNLEKEFYTSSDLNISGERSERLVKMCHMFDCGIYLSPGGAENYIVEDNILPESDVKVIYQRYNCKAYSQFEGKDFISGMSIIDLLFRLDRQESLSVIYQELC